MKYECKCTPKQEYPHIVKSSSVKYYWGIPIISITRTLAPAKSCDHHPVPQKEWCIWLKRTNFVISFGKIIY